MKTKNLGMLKMLKQITELCNAKYLLPCANFNELGPTKLRAIAKLQIKNTPRTISNFFRNHPIDVLEMLPGESWDGKSGKISKRTKHENFLDRENTLKYLDENYLVSIVDSREIVQAFDLNNKECQTMHSLINEVK